VKEISYQPIKQNQEIYQRLYQLYRKLHDAFGGVTRQADLSGVMKELINIREQQAN
jgi:L-ribulokinase